MDFATLKKMVIEKSGLEEWVAHTFLLDYFECTDKYHYPLNIEEQDKNAILSLLPQLVSGKPIPYILGKSYFWKDYFYVDERVLIPRFDTEILVECALMEKDVEHVLDLCTGSGAIGLTIAKELPNAKVTLSDISSKALEVVEINEKRLLSPKDKKRVKIIQSDLLDNIEGEFDLIVSNPPYIPTKDVEQLDDSVKNYEPKLALDGKEDGLAFYRRIIEDSVAHLTDEGKLMLEVGINQAKDVAKYLEKDFKCITIIKDNHGVERVVIARKKER